MTNTNPATPEQIEQLIARVQERVPDVLREILIRQAMTAEWVQQLIDYKKDYDPLLFRGLVVFINMLNLESMLVCDSLPLDPDEE